MPSFYSESDSKKSAPAPSKKQDHLDDWLKSLEAPSSITRAEELADDADGANTIAVRRSTDSTQSGSSRSTAPAAEALRVDTSQPAATAAGRTLSSPPSSPSMQRKSSPIRPPTSPAAASFSTAPRSKPFESLFAAETLPSHPDAISLTHEENAGGAAAADREPLASASTLITQRPASSRTPPPAAVSNASALDFLFDTPGTASRQRSFAAPSASTLPAAQQQQQHPAYVDELERLRLEKQHLEKLMEQLKRQHADELEMVKSGHK